MVFLTQTRSYLKTEELWPLLPGILAASSPVPEHGSAGSQPFKCTVFMLGLTLQGDRRERKQSDPPGLLLTKFSPLDSWRR